MDPRKESVDSDSNTQGGEGGLGNGKFEFCIKSGAHSQTQQQQAHLRQTHPHPGAIGEFHHPSIRVMTAIPPNQHFAPQHPYQTSIRTGGGSTSSSFPHMPTLLPPISTKRECPEDENKQLSDLSSDDDNFEPEPETTDLLLAQYEKVQFNLGFFVIFIRCIERKRSISVFLRMESCI
jgi:hypothetical protein